MATADIVCRCETLYEDLEFMACREWLARAPNRKAVGYMPVYVPRELIHAAGMLPVGILGGGDQLEVIHGDAYYQSYICRIPRSTIELGITGRLDFLSGMLFPSICDVIRNLSGMWQLMFPGKFAHYFDFPQNYRDDVGGDYYYKELSALRSALGELGGQPITDDRLRASIDVYDEHRRAIRDLYSLRSDQPWRAPSSEVYLLLRAAMVLPPEEHTLMVREYIDAARVENRPLRDNCRVVVVGSFCEQPPLNLIKSIEMAGCYIVDDDYMLVTRWMLDDIGASDDPQQALVDAFLHGSADTSSRYCEHDSDIGQFLVDSVRHHNAEGVVFASPSFCDPALLDRPMLADRLTSESIPYISFKYAENTGQMQQFREQAGTFSDSIKLWGEA
jgi:benzoyl-CoA reductase subunit C